MREGVVATRVIAVPLRLLIVLAVVSGLLVAAPAACWCPVDDHAGQLLHPLFAHDHASDHAAGAFGLADGADATAYLASGPSWSSAFGQGQSNWQTGVQVVLPLPSAASAASGHARVALDLARPAQHVPAPTFPPPR